MCEVVKNSKFVCKHSNRFFFAHPRSSLTEANGLKSRSLRTVQSRSLSDIICDNTDAQRVPEKAMLSQNHPMQAMQSCANANGLDFDGIAADILQDEPSELTHLFTVPSPFIQKIPTFSIFYLYNCYFRF